MHTQRRLSEKALALKQQAQGGGEQVTTTWGGIPESRAVKRPRNPWRKRETISVEEAAKILGVGRSAAYAAIHSGDLPGVWFGRRFLVSVPRLTRMIDGE